MEIKVSLSNDTINRIASMYANIDAHAEKVNVSFIKSPNSSLKSCFYNAQKLAISTDWDYVLGFLLVSGIPIEHAWSYGENEYWDTTNKKKLDYYRVTSISVNELKECVAKLGDGYVDLYGLNKVRGHGKI